MQDHWLEHLEKLAALDLNEAQRSILREDITRIISFTKDLPAVSSDIIRIQNPSPNDTPTGERNFPILFSHSLFTVSTPSFKDGFLHVPPIWPLGTEIDDE